MQSQRSSKGKGRAVAEDYEQSFASLSLTDGGDSVTPRPYGSGYPYNTYEQPYTGDGQYAWTGSLLPATSSSSTSYGGTPVYGNSYPTPSTSSTGGYDCQGQPSATSAYSSHSGYDAASVGSSSAPSSYMGGSTSSWSSPPPSNGTGASSVPSANSNRTDVNNTINRQGPATQRHQLPCEFRNLTNCDRVFHGDDTQGWMDHVEAHLQSRFPTRLKCWYCGDHSFDAKKTSDGDTRFNFNMRMQHIRDHIVYEGYRAEHMHTDGHLVEHLRRQGLIDGQTYDNILEPGTVPQIPGGQGHHSGRSDHKSHRGHGSHRSLPQVEEEVAAESSRSKHRRHHPHHHRSEHRRDHGRGHSTSSHRH